MSVAFAISMYLHLLCACIWLGGLMFFVMVIAPMMRHPDLRDRALTLLQESGNRFKRIGWTTLLVLVITGITNFLWAGKGYAQVFPTAAFWKNPYAHILATKVLLVVVMLMLAAVHDFRIGPRARAAWEADPQGEGTLRLRKQAAWIGRINTGLTLLVLLLALFLVRGLPVP